MIDRPETFEEAIRRNVDAALVEDLGSGDITANLIRANEHSTAGILCREQAVFCGAPWVDEVFRRLGGVSINWQVTEGTLVSPDSILCTLEGPTRTLLTGERAALNFLQTLMGTATTARNYANAATPRNITVLDTRKTIPGLRTAQKYAVRQGGCENHRTGLFDAFLIKENHITACGSITNAVEEARKQHPEVPVIVEVETLNELKEAILTAPNQIMLDNFSDSMIEQAFALCGAIDIELSGNQDLETITSLEFSRPVFLSSGALTKNLTSIDLSMRIYTKDTNTTGKRPS